MKNLQHRVLLSYLLLLSCMVAVAQDNTHLKLKKAQPDSVKKSQDVPGKNKGGRVSSLFADSAKLTSSDYQEHIENTYMVLNNIENKGELGLQINTITMKLKDADSILFVLKDNVLNNSGALNLRNLQVFRTLLQNIQTDLKEHRTILDSTDNKLTALKGSLKVLRNDTVLRQLIRDSVIRKQFAAQLKDLRGVWLSSTGTLKKSLGIINRLQTHTSSSMITTVQLLDKVNNLLTTSSIRIFGKEYNYLWEKDTISLTANARSSFGKAYQGEKKALNYYFKDTGNKRLFLLLIGTLFFVWIYRNIRILKKRNAVESVSQMNFIYLPSGYIVSAFVVMFTIAPLFDLHAPSTYIESMQFFLMIILTVICWKKWPRELFRYWIVMVVLYLCFSFTHHLSDPGFWQRFLLILLNVFSFIFGLLFLSKMRQHLHLKGFLRFVIILHNVMNVLAVIFNIWGRVSLAQILGNTAIFSFMQAIGLAVFSQICVEAILLQIVASRVKRGHTGAFEYEHVLKSFRRLILFLVVVLWLIVFTTNLNIYTSLLGGLTDFLKASRSIGNASFTIGGILLFFFIIWVAHLLQRYVGYFLGDTDTEEDINDKGQRSRLLVTKLILLCLGYLLAVAASGVPVDKITIVIGALGVGIGLGLQNIVNNFVSGIVLIFDRPLQIGDVVEIGDRAGKVREIGLRSSTLLTSEGAEVIIPNGDILSQKIVNWTLSNSQRRIEMDIAVGGSTDMEVVSSAIKKAILVSKYVYQSREPQILFIKVNDDGFDVKAFFWISDMSKSGEAKSEILLLLHEKLNAVNMVIKPEKKEIYVFLNEKPDSKDTDTK
ncbi:mechanosensitive ion channel family protein [Mucilaginibacter sp. SG564]|uniref:mechanosensitive ion channel family protein n=1 Tax=Mucilaginibacter sp. SG564 TaxID=2587022 RepID=UPI001551E9C8|nr:mechanosensitive ion channel domain-containing protein [Mucilaginibacter sp. SG564]NOW93535.1 small-conductance mechanosensitive channel [Mucilaginibacter sp. SG564]